MEANAGLHQWSLNVLLKNLETLPLTQEKNKELLIELHKPISRKFKKRKICGFLENNDAINKKI